jgi:hypothetical protein
LLPGVFSWETAFLSRRDSQSTKLKMMKSAKAIVPVARTFLPVSAAGRFAARVLQITGRNACAILAGLFLLIFTAHAGAEPQQLALTADGTRLLISNMPRIALNAIEVTSEEAVPIFWFYRDAKQAELPLILMPGVGDTATFKLIKKQRPIVIDERTTPRIRIDPAAYEKLSSWRPTSSPAERRRTLLLAVAMATTLLLASLARRGAATTVGTVAIAWGVALAIASTSRPTLFERVDDDGTHWFLAAQPQVVRVPISSREAVVPIVESMVQLRTLTPRIVVERTDAIVEFDLPKNAKVGVIRIPR